MNVMMIHGIGQEASTKNELLEKWKASLHSVQPGLLGSSSIEMAYYGEILANWTKGKIRQTVALGEGSLDVDMVDADELKFFITFLNEFAIKNNIDEAQIAVAEGGIVPMDNAIVRRLVGLARLIEKLAPDKGDFLFRLIRQGHTYLSSPGATKAVDDIVRPLLLRTPQVLITHSLGTVIAFKLLREMEEKGEDIKIPLLITMGSPLALEAFKAKLGPPRRKPVFVERWENFYDPSDFVTLGKPLDEKNFASDIFNDGTVDNNTFNAHGIVGYLPHQGVVNALKRVL